MLPTEMIRLRDVDREDRDKLREWRNRPEVARFMHTDHEISPEEHARWFEKMLDDRSSKHWIILSGKAEVGACSLSGIDAQHGRCAWGFYVTEPMARGKGAGAGSWYWMLRHAFDVLRLNRLSSEVLGFNERTLALHRSFGFVEEGRLREHVRKAGGFVDVVCFGMLRREWDSLRPGIERRLREKGILE